jgi:enamine deaminase RidA (YjgF/YER057c/UK114 family)
VTGVLPNDLAASRVEQTTSVFEGIEDALKDADMTFANVARTWPYMDRILEWYDPFNRARDLLHLSRAHLYGLVPASTGIGSANLCGSAITACAIAVKPRVPGAVTVEAVPSPLQCAALEYGSSFSRAVEIGTPECRTLMVSGTASIEPGGVTAYVDDVPRQIQLTMDVVEAILVSRGMGWRDATRAVMYLKKAEYVDEWQACSRPAAWSDAAGDGRGGRLPWTTCCRARGRYGQEGLMRILNRWLGLDAAVGLCAVMAAGSVALAFLGPDRSGELMSRPPLLALTGVLA